MLSGLRIAWNDCLCRCRYPDLYDDALHGERLGEMGRQLTARSVAVIGNAGSIFDVKAGEEIDTADVVIRINRGLVSRPECQGSRTDILCLAVKMQPGEVESGFGAAKVILATPRRWTIGRAMLAAREGLVCYPLDAWADLSRQIGGRRPSSGLMAIDIARRFFGSPAIKLFGFDWKATKTHYSRKLRYGSHDWAAEQSLISRWAAEGWLSPPPRSDIGTCVENEARAKHPA